MALQKMKLIHLRKIGLYQKVSVIIHEDSFDFKIETVGVYQNDELVKEACDIVIDKIEKFNNTLQMKTVKINATESTIENCYDIVLEGEDYTLGKVLNLYYLMTITKKTY